MRLRRSNFEDGYDGYRGYIEALLEDAGPYWNNLVGLTLAEADKKLGRSEANRLIRGLEGLGWTEHPE